MKLVHYSNKDNLDTIDPKYHGSGVQGAESKRKRLPEWENRSYFYIHGTEPEANVGVLPHVYEAEIPDEKIYDIANDHLGIKDKSKMGLSVDPTLMERNIKEAGFHGYRNSAHGDETYRNIVAVFHPVKPIKRQKMNLNKAKNSKEEKTRIFGSDPNAPRLSPKRMKMMQALKAYVQKKHGIDMTVASGKRDESGQLREQADITHEPYDVFTPEGQAEEKARQAKIAQENEARVARGEKPIKRVDPKPDWRSGQLETQPSPDAAAHEIAHLYDEPEGQSLAEMQTNMDRVWGEHQSNYGHLQQKKTAGEIQPMALENPIRRRAGIPATAPYKNPRPMSEHDRPVEQAIDGSGPRFVRGVKPGKKPQSVDYDRMSRLMSASNRRKLDMIDRGEIVFDKDKGWTPGTSPDAKINQRARAIAETDDPDTYFSRKDKDTLMRSDDYNAEVDKKIKDIKEKNKNPKEQTIHDRIKAVKEKYKEWLGKARFEEDLDPKTKRIIREERRITAPKPPVPAKDRLKKDRTDAYAQKQLGALSGKPFHNNFEHPDHASFNMYDHMRAQKIHSNMAADAEKNKMFNEAAHHRGQAAKHKDAWRSKVDSPFVKSDKPKIEIVPHPEEVIDVDPEIIDNMKRRLKNQATANGMKLMAAITRLAGSGGSDMSQPITPEFHQDLKAAMDKKLNKDDTLGQKKQFISQQIRMNESVKPKVPKPHSGVK